MKTLAVIFNSDTIDIVKEKNLLTVASKDSGVVHNQELWISVTKVCKNLGMTKDQIRTQKDRIKADDSFFYKNFSISTEGGNQDALCIPLNKLNGWLFSISHNKVRADIREKLIEYKNECFDVLNAHFMTPTAPQPLLIEAELKTQNLKLTKKLEHLEQSYDKLLEENSQLALPAPAVDLAPYKAENKRLNDALNEMTNLKEHFRTQSGKLLERVREYNKYPTIIKGMMGKFLDFPNEYSELEKLTLKLGRV
jgi:hypothetical protein